MYDNLTKKRIYILTLGCKVNQYESDAMYEAFFAAGAVRGAENAADVCIINTCSVTNIADRKSRQMISKLRKENPEALLVATGCYVQAVSNRSLFDASSKKSSPKASSMENPVSKPSSPSSPSSGRVHGSDALDVDPAVLLLDGIEPDVEMGNCSGMPMLADELHRRGYSDDEIEKIFHGNALRILKEFLPEA